MQFHEYKNYILSDLYRYRGKKTKKEFWRIYFSIPGFKYTFWLRTARFFKDLPLCLPLYILARLILNRLNYKYGICIPYNTSIDTGLYIGHFGGIIVSHKTVIGKNFNINQGVTIGATYGGKKPGTPIIGDNVYVGPGVFIIGGIQIGNNVAIGANTVVNKPVPDNAVVVSPSGEIISYKGAGNYVVNTDY